MENSALAISSDMKLLSLNSRLYSTQMDTNVDWYPSPNAWFPLLESHQLARFLLTNVDWEQKRLRCESLHPLHAKCIIHPSWISGKHNLVRKVVFEDGTNWVLKIPFPNNLTPEGKLASNFGKLNREYKINLWLQSVISIPIPKIYAMDEGSITPFLRPYSHYEAPCLYMEYIDGMTANTRLDESGDVPNEVVRYLLWQLAKVSAEMMSKEVPAAGAVGIDSETGRVTILPGDASDEPTISSTEAFYHRKCKEREEQYGHANIPDSPSLASKFPALYKLLAPDDYFCLFNENLGFNKIIVDENWKITAMIDLDCVRAVPWSWAIRPMYRSMVDVIPDPLLSNDIMARAYEVQMRDDYFFWLQKLHRFLFAQNTNTLRLCRALEQYAGSGGAELTIGLADCGKYGPKWDAEWLKKWASLESRLKPT